MFTGIIEEIGIIKAKKARAELLVFTVLAQKTAPKLNLGDSIAIDGACFTVVEQTSDTFTVEAVPETKNRTIIRHYAEGTPVNLETTLTLQKGISGHLVQGHVDGMGTVTSISNQHEVEIKFPLELSRFLAFKGSVTINGVSLTISKLLEKNFIVSLIPFTLEQTNLGKLQPGNEVNLEIDLIARYLERMVDEKEGHAKYNFLKERNLI